MEQSNHHDEHHGHPEQKYTCPMHPEIIKPNPGKCPLCGMNLVPVDEVKRNEKGDDSYSHDEPETSSMHEQRGMHAAHDKHAGHHTP